MGKRPVPVQSELTLNVSPIIPFGAGPGLMSAPVAALKNLGTPPTQFDPVIEVDRIAMAIRPLEPFEPHD
jgi:hypothetical protein